MFFTTASTWETLLGKLMFPSKDNLILLRFVSDSGVRRLYVMPDEKSSVEFARQDAEAERMEGVSSPPAVEFLGITHVLPCVKERHDAKQRRYSARIMKSNKDQLGDLLKEQDEHEQSGSSLYH